MNTKTEIKMKKTIFLLLLISLQISAQVSKTNSFFDNLESKEYSLNNILIEGEVFEPGIVDLTSLPLCSFPGKDLSFQNNKNKFIGSYYYYGYSLYDILNQKLVKKANEEEFKPYVDLYLIVENDKGEKAVFSWGEIFYSKDNLKTIITKSVRAINPSKMKMKWELPNESRLVCGYDAFNFRSISNPTKIIVKSFAGNYSKEKIKNVFSPEILVLKGSEKIVIQDAAGFEKREFRGIGFGHGMGWKGIDIVEGFVFKNVLMNKVNIDLKEIGTAIVCASAKDGYRVTFSLSEIINRNDMNDFLLIEKNGAEDNGKFNLFATPDFFVDRNVRSVEKVEIVNVK